MRSTTRSATHESSIRSLRATIWSYLRRASGRRWLTGRLTKLGRHDENDVVLAGPTVSARHATVRVEPIGVVLEDEGSLNGTFVNGERIEQRLLEEGDRIQVGPHLLLFVPAI